MELTLVGLQNSGKTTFVNVIAVRKFLFRWLHHHSVTLSTQLGFPIVLMAISTIVIDYVP